jgi:hypothetical protein
MGKRRHKDIQSITKITGDSSSSQKHMESVVEFFEKKWGIELTGKETREIIERAASRVLESDDEMEIQPAVRDEMFAMMIRKDPERAISFRMNIHENKGGKRIAPAHKQMIMWIAREQGFAAAKKELNKYVRGSRSSGALGKEIESFKTEIVRSRKMGREMRGTEIARSGKGGKEAALGDRIALASGSIKSKKGIERFRTVITASPGQEVASGPGKTGEEQEAKLGEMRKSGEAVEKVFADSEDFGKKSRPMASGKRRKKGKEV